MRVLDLHAPVKPVQRSKGHSAVAAAAYRSASRLRDERTGELHDYRRKGGLPREVLELPEEERLRLAGVEHTALLLPDNAPDWAHDRRRLWNAAETRERHVKAQTARELLVAFPHEMNSEQRRLAGYTVAQHLVDRYGVAVDIAFHEPSKAGDQRNHHAHLLFSVRRFDPERPDGWAKTKDRMLDDRGKDKGATHSRGALEVLHLRERVATIMNEIAATHELDVYVEHLSFEARGLDREATKHLGRDATAMERNYRAHQQEVADGRKPPDAPAPLRSRRAEKNESISQANALREEREVIDLEIERERRRLAQQQAEQKREAAARESIQHRRRFYYQAVQRDRRALIEAQREEFEANEAALRRELVQLHEKTNQVGLFGFMRFWHQLTGRQEANLQRIEVLQKQYDEIQAEKRQQQEAFEQRRLAQLEAVKAREVAAERLRARALDQQAQAVIDVFQEPAPARLASDRLAAKAQQQQTAKTRLEAHHKARRAKAALQQPKRPAPAPELSQERQIEQNAQDRQKAEALARLRRMREEQRERDQGLDRDDFDIDL